MKAVDTEKGIYILYEGQPNLILERDIYSPGKGSAIVHLKLQNMKTGGVLKVVMKTGDDLEEVEMQNKDVKFLYSHRDDYCFTEGADNKRIMIGANIIGDKKDFLKAGITYQLVLFEDEPISLRVPIKMELLVTEAEESAKGNTATGDTKEVVLETGLKVKTPSFIKKGDRIIVNTEERKYTERA